MALAVLHGCAGEAAITPGENLINAAIGGKVIVGTATLTIPPGSLSQDTGITAAAATGLPAPPAGKAVLPGSAYTFGPDGTAFDPPATLSIAYGEARGAMATPPAIYQVQGNQWVAVQGSQFDGVANKVTAPLAHLSTYAILTSISTEQSYELIDLGMLPGDNFASAVSINESGQVLVYSALSGPSEHVRAAIWDGAYTELGTLGNRRRTVGVAINDQGTVVGQCDNGSNVDSVAFVYKNGQIQELLPGTGPVVARDINASGQILGHTNFDGFILNTDGQRTVLDIKSPRGLNASAHTVGRKGTDGIGLYRNGASELLTFPSDWQTISTFGLNDNDQVIGQFRLGGNDLFGFVWTNGVATSFSGPANVTQITPLAINNAGTVVGTMVTQLETSAHSDAFLWDGTSMINLTTKIPAGSPFSYLDSARAINESGWIVGMGLVEGQAHAYLLKPILGG
ncbi:MAG: hypothetical protein ACAH95_06495 [Fimbriimonas sp.]